LLHIPSTEEDLVEKEVKAIKRLCGPGAHVNIVQVLNHGHLSNAPFYFIDMEFCDLNLHDYIHRKSPPDSSESRPYFIREGSSVSTGQIWVVMSQIAAGVGYIHRKGHIHRDIKPANGVALYHVTDVLVLYSRKDALWKLADFGLTVEGSSRTNRPTQYSRGTQGYRAPELLGSDNEPTYTNKVDVWSMGCILYELATGIRAFQTDWALLSYLHSQKNKDVFLDDTFDSRSIETITNHIVGMLQINPSDRPSASSLSEEFDQLRLAQDDVQLGTDTNSVTSQAVNAKTEPTPPMPQEHESIASSDILPAVTDETDQTPPTAQIHPVDTNETETDTPSLPSHLIGVSLYSMAGTGDIEAVKILLNAKADVAATDGEGRTALHLAARGGHKDVVVLLLDKNPDIIASTDSNQRMALHWAARGGHKDVVALLLDKMEGTSIAAKDSNKRTALQLAARGGHKDVVALLEKWVLENKERKWWWIRGNAS